MKINSLTVKNFRSIKHETFSFEKICALVGTNGSGKSTVLNALDYFYSGKSTCNLKDFFNEDSSKPIEIIITFSELSAAEKDLFKRYIQNEVLSVAKEYITINKSGTYHGYKAINTDFVEVRNSSNATAFRELYNGLKGTPKYSSLPQYVSKAAAETAMDKWEDDNLTELTISKDIGQFFGFDNNSTGKLSQFTKFIFVRAVADIKEHATDGKQSVIGALMDLLIRKSLSENSELQKTQEEYSEKIKTLLEPYKTGPLSKVSKDITDILQKYYTELEASLSINEESISIPLPIPKAELNIKEGDHSFNIESMGHGVQRATIISLLQYLAIHNHKQSGESAPMNLVLGIEEPELYQHPSRQKQFFQVLKELTNGGISGVSGTVQIIYATHSPYFVELTSVNNISKIYKSPITGLPSETKAHKTTLNEIMQRVASAWGVSEDKVTEISNLAHISTCNPQVHEGFFARKVILVEGESDKAALETIATLSNKGDFVSRDISIISCGGKTLIDKPFAAFSSLNIPTIAIWDWDDDSNDSQTKNIALLKLCGADSDIKPTEGQQIDILENCAFFKTTLEACLKHDFGDGVFDKLIEEVGSSASLKKKDWQVKWPKRSFVIARALENAYKQGKKSSSIEKLLDKILAQ